MNKIWSLIPAYTRSTRLPGKNTTNFLLGDRPLLCYTIDAVVFAGYTPHLFTNEKNLMFNVEIPIIERPEEICTPQTTMKETVQRFIEIMEIPQDDIILLTYLTCPFRTAESITNAIDKFKRYKAKSLQSLSIVEYRPYGLMKAIDKKEGEEYSKFRCMVPQKGIYQYQNMPRQFRANGAIYLFYVSELEKLNNQMFNDNTIGYLLPDPEGLDIDTELDYLLAKAILEEREKDEHSVNQLSDTGRCKTEYYTDWNSTNSIGIEKN